MLARAQAEGRLWVALGPEGGPVGFALTDAEGDTVHLLELAVHPEHGRRGVGRRLVEAVVTSAREEGRRAVVLTTFADIPWNAPFYERLGFRRLEEGELSPVLARTLREEAADGLRDRVAMRLALPPAAPYVVRLMFEWGSGALWAGNDAARARFAGDPCEDLLPLSDETRATLERLSVWHDTSLNWEYPPDPGPWSDEEAVRFEEEAARALATVRAELGPDYEVVYVPM